MKKSLHEISLLLFSLFFLLIFPACKEKNKIPTNESINAISLKGGEVVLCGPPGKQYGSVEFETSCSDQGKKYFNFALALLHSFEYDEAEKAFAKTIAQDPGCAMAYWGVAMSNYHPLWSPPTQPELEKGAKAIAIAKSLSPKSKRESDYIDAISLFYKNWDRVDHHTRSLYFEKAMENVYTKYPNDKEAGIFYALALDAAADPGDKSYSNQKKAGTILTALYPGQPNHPGIVHYIIHTYDYPELAALALPAARRYASIAPSSAHAQHMPSHIFTRMGLWDESIISNLASASSARCYAENAGIKAHWGEELHDMDYLVYAYLQKAENNFAKEQCDYLKTIQSAYPVDFKVAYAFAAIPARYFLENKMWKEAAGLNVYPANFPWEKFPWQIAITHFTRLLGSVHMGNIESADAELGNLITIQDTLTQQKDIYKANQVQIQIETGKAWILYEQGKNKDALRLMNAAADREDKTEKHPVTPGEVLPAMELLGDMLLQMNEPGKSLEAYESDLKKHPNRFNGLYGAGLAAERINKPDKTNFYFQQLVGIANSGSSNRPELKAAKLFLKKRKPLVN